MLLRQQTADRVDVLHLTGPVAGEDAYAVASAVEEATHRGPGRVVIDLRDVTAVSQDAVDALRGLTAHRTGGPWACLDLRGASPHVQQAFAGLSVHRDAVELHEAVVIEHGPHGPAQARRVVAACAAQLGLDGEADDLLLLVSELVTNAIRHGAPPVELRLEAHPETITVAVADSSPVPPLRRDADESAEGGRGMALVDLLTDGHGVRAEPGGKTVWASVRRQHRVPSA